MNILLTNDDGIYARGLWTVYRRLKAKHAITVVAPDRERSAAGHGITLNEPLRLEKVEVNGGFQGFAVSGTPVDCIRLGVLEILDVKPDLVISGINPGSNVGININYSGTVAAAREAALYGIPAIALSIKGCDAGDYEMAARIAEILSESIFRNGLPHGTMLNVNLPDLTSHPIAGVKISRQGITTLADCFDKRVDPRNKTYYWQGGEFRTVFDHSDMDGAVLESHFISITPIKCDMTDYTAMDDLKSWNIEKKVLKNEKTVYKRS